jgi:hypothetical protein
MQARREWLGWLATGGLAVGLTLVFWLPIWCGAGFVGGDIYSYFFPQKVIYAEALHAGELPLWNAHAGFGYPLLAESQTGIFYPPNLLLYSWLDAHSAFHASFLCHYIAAFVFSTMAARRLGLSLLPSWLTALVYVYGWFPPRTCVEWAIIGGTWLPAALWSAESFLATRRWRFAIGLSGVLGAQLLAGHFQIAWFTLLLLAVYVPARVWFISSGRQPMADGRWPLSFPLRTTSVTYMAILFGLTLAAVQLVPTYELKQLSQRATVNKDHELDFGSIPPWYWSQVCRPSHWYSPLTDRDDAFRNNPPLGHSRTNLAEAHLYFGVAPLMLFVASIIGLLSELVSKRTLDRSVLFWLAVAIVSGLYTSGWLLPLTRHLPGFSYFQGPGRYGLLTTWAVAVLAGSAVDHFLRSPDVPRCLTWVQLIGSVWSLSVWYLLGDDVAAVMMQFPNFDPLTLMPTNAQGTGPFMSLLQLSVLMAAVIVVCAVLWWLSERPNNVDVRVGLIGLVLLTTAVEFWTISRLVTFTQIVESPPLKSLEQSPVRQKLLEAAKTRPTLRLFAPGANVPSTLGVSSTPIYLTFGPAEYVNDSLRQSDDWRRRGGVTHLLTFDPQPPSDSLRLLWQGNDPFLNRAWGRSGQPLYLYELLPSFGRAQLRGSDGQALLLNSQLTSFHSRANAVECSVDLSRPGVLVLLDLDYPGWTVTVDGQPAESLRIGNLFRGVKLEAGTHQVVWSYRPRSVLIGAVISMFTLLLLATAAHVRFWHPRWFAWLDEPTP